MRRRFTGTSPSPTKWPREWKGEVDVVFIDGDHSEAGCELDWSSWHGFVAPGGRVVFHDARADQPGGRGLPGPTAVVKRHFRSAGTTATTMPDWKITAEADRTVVVTRAPPEHCSSRSA